MVQSEGNMSLKNPVTPPAIDPGTFRLVAQRLNHYATPGPSFVNTDVNLRNKSPNLINKDVSKSKARMCVEVMHKTCLNTNTKYSLQT